MSAVNINWTLNVQVVGGPQISLPSRTIHVEAYDVIEVTVKNEATDQPIEVQPATATLVRFLLINSDQFDDGSPPAPPTLSYKAEDDSGSGAGPIRLDAPHLLIGDGAVGLLVKAPKKLLFTNTLGSDVNIKIFVGRNVGSS